MAKRSLSAQIDLPSGAVPGVEIVALVTSAGGLEALSAVLRALPADFPAAVVVGQHLSGRGSTLVEILRRRLALPVVWARDGSRLEPGTVTVCPPRSLLEVLPDRSCAVRPGDRAATDRPLDVLLASVADSIGPASLAVVLSGMGSDGSGGAAAVRAAGGVVIAQSEETAEQPSMPRAVVDRDAANLILPLHQIGAQVVDVVAGLPLPLPGHEADAVRRVFGEDGEIARLARGIDWATTPLGAVSDWPETQVAAIRLAMAAPYAVSLHLGSEHVLIFNEASIPTMAEDYERVFGIPSVQSYPEVADMLLPVLAQASAGTAVHFEARKVPYVRDGRMRDAWFDGSYVAIPSGDGTVLGVQQTFLDRTEEVLGRRRLETLNRLAVTPTGRSRKQALEAAIAVLDEAEDVPLAAAYLLHQTRSEASLVAVSGVEPGSAMAPHRLRLGSGAAWPLRRAVDECAEFLVDDVAKRFRGQLVTDERLSLEQTVLIPLRDQGVEGGVAGVLILGVRPTLLLDSRYRGFLSLVGETIGAKVNEAHARQRERDRLERLAELDRVKTEFFSNVSHEFRTPLTLMLGPLDELDSDGLSDAQRADLELVRRNARRLFRLVGTMLDFSQIEAGRLRAHFAPVDLTARTREIAAQFESATRRAGLTLTLDLAELSERVWVDSEMWEKIVSNLLSNALKFTFEGEIEVTLRALPNHVELVVRDTGVGIPDEELPHVLKRFHRVRDTRARTYEGAGIGLALVDELVRRHHGRVRVTSTVGEGTTFTVWLPLGRRRARAEAPPGALAAPEVAAAMAEEAGRWGEAPEPMLFDDDDGARRALGAYAPSARILVADDSQDMRDYLARLIAPHWDVEMASDGAGALALARRNPPDLILADVMMPGLDGFALLRELRQDADLRSVPVVLVTARAGEESAIEGLLAGAEDYIVKPFSARELVARVGGQLELARARQRAAELNAFRIGLSDALRALDDPLEIQRTACRMLVEQLGADRVGFVEADPAGGQMIQTAVHGSALAHMPGRGAIDAWRPFAESIRDGERIVAEDTQTHPKLAEVRDALADLKVGAQLFFPLQRDGRGVVALSVQQRVPRAWTAEEVALAEEAAGRTWAEVEQARLKADLQKSEARFRTLAEAAPLGVAVTDRGQGVIVYANRAYEALMDYDRGELVGQPSTSVYYDPADRSWLAEMVEKGMLTGHDVRFKRKDGRPVWVAINVAPIDFDGRPAIVGIVQAIGDDR